MKICCHGDLVEANLIRSEIVHVTRETVDPDLDENSNK